MINESEQFKLGGDCEKCKRKSYCSNECTQHKKKSDRMLHNKINSLFYTVLKGMSVEGVKYENKDEE